MKTSQLLKKIDSPFKSSLKIFIIIPVFNRLDCTKQVLDALRTQTIYHHIKIIIVDDGSNDGTDKFLSEQGDVILLKGAGDLWWSGATQIGLNYAYEKWNPGDFVLFLNNDLIFSSNFIESLIAEAEQFPNSAIGSVLCHRHEINKILRIGPKIDLKNYEIYDISSKLQLDELIDPMQRYEVDALGGRGTLYRIEFFERYGMLKPHLLPHYFADYEISMRFKRRGIKLIVSTLSRVYSEPQYGHNLSSLNFYETFFSNKSQKNLLQSVIFYYLISSGFNKIKMSFISLYWGLKEVCSYILKSRKYVD